MMSEFRKELEDVALAFDQMETALADSQARIEILEQRLQEAGVPAPRPAPPPPKVFDTIHDIEWERVPVDELYRFPDLAMRVQMGFYPKAVRESGEFMPHRQVIVKQYGELTNVRMREITGIQPDFELICNRRCADVVPHYKPAIVQDGDDGFETDVADIEFHCRNYQGGLNQPLSSWREDYQQYAQILAQARPDLVGEWEYHLFNLAPTP